MINITDRLHISTTSTNAHKLALENGIGIELTEFCTAYNMDTFFEESNKSAMANMAGIERFTFHAPFNELTPAAIDPLILDIAKKRYDQAFKIMSGYGIKKMIAHSGYMPHVYYEQWFTPKSIDFWKEYLSGKPKDFHVCLENVLEDSPHMLIDIVEAVNDSRLLICFDVAHAQIMGEGKSLIDWAKMVMPYLGHVHIHNNHGQFDTHNALNDGVIDIESLITLIAENASTATFSIESIDAESSLDWLKGLY
jgi:sugar phosphate isomerase/epimerase